MGKRTGKVDAASRLEQFVAQGLSASDIARRMTDEFGTEVSRCATISVLRTCGHDGNPPEFQDARDYPDVVTMDGPTITREAVKGPQNINIDRIEWMYAHGKIGARQHAAAVRLESDWQMALINPVASSVLVGAGGSMVQLPNDAKCDAMERHGAARNALGYDWKLVDMIVHGRLTVVQAARVLHIHHQKAAGRFDSALHHLADHYGLPNDQNVGDAKNIRAAS